MYKDGDYKGLSLEDAMSAIHEELEENRAFLQMTILDPDPDNRPAEDLRIQKVLELAAVMKDILETLSMEKEEEAAEERRNKPLPCQIEEIDLEYKTHTLGEPDGGENIEQDWNMDAAGCEIKTAEETGEKKAKKKKDKKKEKKSKQDKKKKDKKK